jgi:hypothetical protein
MVYSCSDICETFSDKLCLSCSQHSLCLELNVSDYHKMLKDCLTESVIITPLKKRVSVV